MKTILTTILILIFVISGYTFLKGKNVNRENIQERIIAENIPFNGKEVTAEEKIYADNDKTKLVIKDKNGMEKKIDEFLKNNDIPVKILDVFPFKTQKDEYIVAITKSYVKVNNEILKHNGYDLDIYIYNSNNREMYEAEQSFYLNEKKEYQEFDLSNKSSVLEKLNELAKEGKL